MNTDTPIKLTNHPTEMWLQAIAGPRDTEGKELKWREAPLPKGDWHDMIELLHETIALIDAAYDRLPKQPTPRKESPQ